MRHSGRSERVRSQNEGDGYMKRPLRSVHVVNRIGKENTHTPDQHEIENARIIYDNMKHIFFVLRLN